MTRAVARDPNVLGEPSLLPRAERPWSGFPVDWTQASASAEARNVTHPVPVIAMIERGRARAEFRFGSRFVDLDLDAGCIGFFAAGAGMHDTRWRCESVRRVVLQLDFESPAGLGTELSDHARQMPAETQILFRDEELGNVLRAMVRERADGCPNGRLYAESLSLGVALRMQKRTSIHEAAARERGRLTPAQVKRIEELVRSQLSADLPLAMLAATAGFSIAQFVRLFRHTFDCTPHQYVLRLRLERARELAMATQLPLAAVAESAGFCSQSHLTAAFVRAYGLTPGALRRQLRAGK